MKNTIRILSVVAVVMSVLSLLSCGVVIVFQKPLLELFNYSLEVPFTVPVTTVFGYLRKGLFAAFVCLVVNSRKLGIWAEIVLLVLNVLLYPILDTVLSVVEAVYTERFYGMVVLAGRTTLSELCAWPNLIFGYAYPLCLLVCGMSIAYKVLQKGKSRNNTAA